jgi:hypothetical protein
MGESGAAGRIGYTAQSRKIRFVAQAEATGILLIGGWKLSNVRVGNKEISI